MQQLHSASFKNSPGTCLLLAIFLFCLSFSQSVSAQVCYGLSGNNLIKFDATAPAVILSSTAITGFSSGMDISCLDFRPATGELYALGYVQATGMARLHVINTTNATATAIGAAAVMLQANMGKVSMDFNPTVDRIRIIGSNNANYRLHPVTGAIAATDGTLAFAAGDPNVGQNPSIGAVAYTNSYIGATSTTLINFDDSLNVFCAQIPPNNGTLNTIGSAGIIVDLVNTATDFDIFFDQLTHTNVGLFCANLSLLNTSSALFKVNLSTGLTTLVGNIGGAGMIVQDFACQTPKPSTAAITGKLAVALTANGNLVTFDTDSPGDIRTQIGVSGLAMGQALVGLDFRPATGELYGLGYNATATNYQLYKINFMTGMASAVNATPVTLDLGIGTRVGFDFNPTVDRIRVVAANNANFRLHPGTGAIAATDGTLAFAAGDLNAGQNPAIGACGYTNSYIGATSTTLISFDDSLNIFCLQNPPNNGTLNTMGAAGILVDLTNPSTDFDVYFDQSTHTNVALFCANLNTLAGISALYKVNLSTGLATLVDNIGFGVLIKDLACQTLMPSSGAVTGQLAVVLTSNNNLLTFDTDSPTEVRTQIGVSGLSSGQVLVGMDFRPATGELIGLGYEASTKNCQLYKINFMSGVAIAINASPFTLDLGSGASVGFDFNPTVDRIRVVAANNLNVRLNPITGAIAATDINLSFAPGDVNASANAAISAAAYSNSFNGTTTTTLFAYDDSLNVLCTQIPPNNGILNTIGSASIVLNLVDPSLDFDIYYDHASATNIGYAIANAPGTNFDFFYSVDFATGTFSNGIQIGYGCAAKDLAIVIDSIPTTTAVFAPEQLDVPFQVMPNPVSEWTTFNFDLQSSAGMAQLILTNAQGQMVANSLQEKLVAGRNTFNWQVGSNPAGLYVATLLVDGQLRASTRVAVIR